MKCKTIQNLTILILTIVTTICTIFVTCVVYDEFYTGVDISGTWLMYDTVKKSANQQWVDSNLNLTFQVNFIQNAFNISGSGDKRKENDSIAKYHSILTIDGNIRGKNIRAKFVEEGDSGRISTGFFLWEVISKDTLLGTFNSTARESSGSSKLVRKPK
ncbi:MAG: hypothetical protein V1779_05470 [bacterium]